MSESKKIDFAIESLLFWSTQFSLKISHLVYAVTISFYNTVLLYLKNQIQEIRFPSSSLTNETTLLYKLNIVLYDGEVRGGALSRVTQNCLSWLVLAQEFIPIHSIGLIIVQQA